MPIAARGNLPYNKITCRGKERVPFGARCNTMDTVYDLFLFAGQSNMAGRGITSDRWPQPAPALVPGAGWEYRVVSDPDRLHPVAEPFGAEENDPAGIYEPGMKTGSLVTAFVNSYYERIGVPVIGVSASKGGSAICQWQGERDYLSDAVVRWQRAQQYLERQKIPVRHRFMVWCQGETDGDHGTDPAAYKSMFRKMLDQLREQGVETCFLIAIGEYNGTCGYDYTAIHQAQLELAREEPDVVLISDDFYGMRARGLMKDSFHYYQAGYNEVGIRAGAAAAEYLLYGQVPRVPV